MIVKTCSVKQHWDEIIFLDKNQNRSDLKHWKLITTDGSPVSNVFYKQHAARQQIRMFFFVK
jgi:hypothetical protein